MDMWGAFYAPGSREGKQILQIKTGSWPLLVKRGGLEVLHRFPVQRRGGKTASFLREGLSIPLLAVPALSMSSKLAKSLKLSKSVE
jgi:hypothetical protein